MYQYRSMTLVQKCICTSTCNPILSTWHISAMVRISASVAVGSTPNLSWSVSRSSWSRWPRETMLVSTATPKKIYKLGTCRLWALNILETHLLFVFGHSFFQCVASFFNGFNDVRSQWFEWFVELLIAKLHKAEFQPCSFRGSPCPFETLVIKDMLPSDWNALRNASTPWYWFPHIARF